MEKKRRIAFVVATPMQAFTALNIITYMISAEDAIIDLFFRNDYKNANSILRKLSRYLQFDNILVHEENLSFGIKGKARVLTSTIWPAFFLQKKCNVYKGKKNGFYYDEIYAGTYTIVAVSLRLINRQAKLYLYDDGCGSYLTNGIEFSFANRKKIYRVLGKELPDMIPCALLVNNSGFCQNDMKCKIVNVDRTWMEDQHQRKVLQSVFDYKERDIYNERRIVYLSQPTFTHQNTHMKIRMEQALEEVRDQCVFRVHPSDDTKRPDNAIPLEEGSMWELICQEQIGDEHILVGNFSTAQVTPKTMFGKEPWIIFTYEMFQLPPQELNGVRMFVELLRKNYSDEKKVIVVKDINDMMTNLHSILQKDN